MSALCEGRVAIVTGAGRGIGREYALLLAKHGAKVVVNDLGTGADGVGADQSPAAKVVEEIRAAGGEAVANGNDVSDWEGAKALVDQAISSFGKLDAVINNAGILRDRMMVNMTEQEWDAVIKVNLKGSFAPAHHAANYWRARSKASGQPAGGRIINTTSVSGIYGNVGQANYGAAKAGIAAFTIIASQELGRIGVTVNAIAPRAETRLTSGLRERTEEEMEKRRPFWVAPIVVWLASTESHDVTGRIFEAGGGVLAVAEGWHQGQSIPQIADPAAIGPALRKMLNNTRPNADMYGMDMPKQTY